MITKEELLKIRRIEITARKLSGEAFAGEYKSAFKGRGLYFDEIREYQEGDDVRLIDWTATARFAKPFVKVFREERQLEIYLAVDVSSSQNFGSQNATKRELCANISAALSFAAGAGKDNVGLILFTNKIEKIIKPKVGRVQALKIIREILEFEPNSKASNLKNAFEHIANLIKKRSYIFILSDFIDLDYTLALSKLSKNKEIIALKIQDPREKDISDVGLIEIIDSESGKTAIIDSSDKNVRTLWRLNNIRYNEEFSNALKKSGIDGARLECGKPFIDDLARLFAKRKSRSH